MGLRQEEKGICYGQLKNVIGLSEEMCFQATPETVYVVVESEGSRDSIPENWCSTSEVLETGVRSSDYRRCQCEIISRSEMTCGMVDSDERGDVGRCSIVESFVCETEDFVLYSGLNG